MDWFLYDNGRRLERVNLTALNSLLLDLKYAPIDIMSKGGLYTSSQKKSCLVPGNLLGENFFINYPPA